MWHWEKKNQNKAQLAFDEFINAMRTHSWRLHDVIKIQIIIICRLCIEKTDHIFCLLDKNTIKKKTLTFSSSCPRIYHHRHTHTQLTRRVAECLLIFLCACLQPPPPSYTHSRETYFHCLFTSYFSIWFLFELIFSLHTHKQILPDYIWKLMCRSQVPFDILNVGRRFSVHNVTGWHDDDGAAGWHARGCRPATIFLFVPNSVCGFLFLIRSTTLQNYNVGHSHLPQLMWPFIERKIQKVKLPPPTNTIQKRRGDDEWWSALKRRRRRRSDDLCVIFFFSD